MEEEEKRSLSSIVYNGSGFSQSFGQPKAVARRRIGCLGVVCVPTDDEERRAFQMPVATLTLELAIEHAQSLKDRRQAVRSLKDKLRHGFNISVAELDDALVWNRATIGVAAISSSPAYLAGQLREVEAAARRLATGLGCDILDSYIESDVVLDSET
jgi:uncharacterized protein YlxP (DUF503 family)